MSIVDTDSKPELTAREVTDEEVAFFEEHGWVKLNGLISPALAAEFLTEAKKLKESVTARLKSPDVTPFKFERFATPSGDITLDLRKLSVPEGQAWLMQDERGREFFKLLNVQTDPFFTWSRSRAFGRAMSRLLNFGRLSDKEIPVRTTLGPLFCKEPGGAGVGTINYHQDFCSPPGTVDRANSNLTCWIALDEVTPEQGPMRFFDGSHRAGPLGDFSNTNGMLERYPKLGDYYELTPPIHYNAGDATVHHPLMIHTSLDNISTKPRWSFIPGVMAEDCPILKPDVFESDAQPGTPEWERLYPIIYP